MKDIKLELDKLKASFKLLKPCDKFVKKESEKDDFNLSVNESLELISKLERERNETVLRIGLRNLRTKLDELLKIRMK